MRSAALRTLKSVRGGVLQSTSLVEIVERRALGYVHSLNSTLISSRLSSRLGPSGRALAAQRHYSAPAQSPKEEAKDQNEDGNGRKWSTPLAKQLGEAIEVCSPSLTLPSQIAVTHNPQTTGPVPLASYMRMCLTADIGGYYTGAIEEGRDQFGLKGDFVTSPEISQVFGELCGIWFVAEWMAQGRKTKGVELIEVGPGRGTLMDDMLRVSLVDDPR